MTVDLTGMSTAELKTLARDVEKALKVAADTERKEAIKAARLAAQEHGFDLDELVGAGGAAKAKAAGSKNPPKYRNPANPDQTWSGRGRRPAWIADAEAAGKSLEDMAI